MSDDIRAILTGNDFGLFPDEMTPEYMALFRMREIADIRDRMSELSRQIGDLLLENQHLKTDVAIKAQARKSAALWKLKHDEIRSREERYRVALMEIGIASADPDAQRIACVAFGVEPGKVRAWRRAAKAKLERMKLHPSRRKT